MFHRDGLSGIRYKFGIHIGCRKDKALGQGILKCLSQLKVGSKNYSNNRIYVAKELRLSMNIEDVPKQGFTCNFLRPPVTVYFLL